jgi:hypothetical protein
VYNQFDAPTTAHDDTPAEIVTDGGAPRAHTVARRLGVEPDRLQQFVTRHPDPDVSAVDGAFGVDTGDERLVERWLDARPTRGETA